MFLRPATISIAVLTLLTCAPASADDTDGEPPVFPQMSVTVRYPTATTHEVCWSGRLRGTTAAQPTWRVVTSGERSDGTPIADGPLVQTGASVTGCFTVDKGTVAGSYTTTFGYHGVGPDVPSVIAGAGQWAGTLNNKVESHQ